MYSAQYLATVKVAIIFKKVSGHNPDIILSAILSNYIFVLNILFRAYNERLSCLRLALANPLIGCICEL